MTANDIAQNLHAISQSSDSLSDQVQHTADFSRDVRDRMESIQKSMRSAGETHEIMRASIAGFQESIRSMDEAMGYFHTDGRKSQAGE